jgi:hypothetical protein
VHEMVPFKRKQHFTHSPADYSNGTSNGISQTKSQHQPQKKRHGGKVRRKEKTEPSSDRETKQKKSKYTCSLPKELVLAINQFNVLFRELSEDLGQAHGMDLTKSPDSPPTVDLAWKGVELSLRLEVTERPANKGLEGKKQSVRIIGISGKVKPLNCRSRDEQFEYVTKWLQILGSGSGINAGKDGPQDFQYNWTEPPTDRPSIPGLLQFDITNMSEPKDV